MNAKSFIYWWFPVAVWAAVIFLFSSLSTVPSAKIIWWDFIIKKTAHLIEYAVLFFLLLRALTKFEPKLNLKPLKFQVFFPAKIDKKMVLGSFLLCLLYTLSDEYHQGFTPGRYPSLRDVGIDFLGMLLSFTMIKKNSKIKEG